MFKRSFIKSLSNLLIRSQTKSIYRTFSSFDNGNKKNEFNFEENNTVFDFTSNDQMNYQEEMQFSNKKSKGSDLSNLSMLLNPNNLKDIENFLNNLKTDIPRQTIGLFLKVTCHLMKKTSNLKEINLFLGNEKLKTIILSIVDYFQNFALDSEFVDFIQFLDISETKVKKNFSFFGISPQQLEAFYKKITERIENENYDIRSLSKILIFSKRNYPMRNLAKAKLLKELENIEQFQELEDFFMIRIFEIITMDQNMQDLKILNKLLENNQKILELSTRNLIRIFLHVSVIQKNFYSKDFYGFQKKLLNSIMNNENSIDFHGYRILMESIDNLDVKSFPEFQEFVLNLYINFFSKDGYFYTNIVPLIIYFANHKRASAFKNHYERFLEALKNYDVQRISEKGFFGKKKLYFVKNLRNNKLKILLKEKLFTIVKNEIDQTGKINSTPILFLIQKEDLESIWDILINNLYMNNQFNLQILAIQNNLTLPEEIKNSNFNKGFLSESHYEMISPFLNPQQKQQILDLFNLDGGRKNFKFFNYFQYEGNAPQLIADVKLFQKNYLFLKLEKLEFYQTKSVIQLLNLYNKFLQVHKEDTKLISKTVSSFLQVLNFFINEYDLFKLIKSEILDFIKNLTIVINQNSISNNSFQIFIKELIKNHFDDVNSKREKTIVLEFLEIVKKTENNKIFYEAFDLIYNKLNRFQHKNQNEYFKHLLKELNNGKNRNFNMISNFLFCLPDVQLTEQENQILAESEKRFFENIEAKEIITYKDLASLLKLRSYDDIQILEFLEKKDFSFFKNQTFKLIMIFKLALMRFENNKSRVLTDFFKDKFSDNFLKFKIDNLSQFLQMISLLKSYEQLKEIDYFDLVDNIALKFLNNVNENPNLKINSFKSNTFDFFLNFPKFYPEISTIFDKFTLIDNIFKYKTHIKFYLQYINLYQIEPNENVKELYLINSRIYTLIEQLIFIIIKNTEGEERTTLLSNLLKNWKPYDSFDVKVILLWLKIHQPELYDREGKQNLVKINKSKISLKEGSFKRKIQNILDFSEIKYEFDPSYDGLLLSDIYFPESKIYLQFKMKTNSLNKNAFFILENTLREINKNEDIKFIVVDFIDNNYEKLLGKLTELDIIKKEINLSELENFSFTHNQEFNDYEIRENEEVSDILDEEILEINDNELLEIDEEIMKEDFHDEDLIEESEEIKKD